MASTTNTRASKVNPGEAGFFSTPKTKGSSQGETDQRAGLKDDSNEVTDPMEKARARTTPKPWPALDPTLGWMTVLGNPNSSRGEEWGSGMMRHVTKELDDLKELVAQFKNNGIPMACLVPSPRNKKTSNNPKVILIHHLSIHDDAEGDPQLLGLLGLRESAQPTYILGWDDPVQPPVTGLPTKEALLAIQESFRQGNKVSLRDIPTGPKPKEGTASQPERQPFILVGPDICRAVATIHDNANHYSVNTLVEILCNHSTAATFKTFTPVLLFLWSVATGSAGKVTLSGADDTHGLKQYRDYTDPAYNSHHSRNPNDDSRASLYRFKATAKGKEEAEAATATAALTLPMASADSPPEANVVPATPELAKAEAGFLSPLLNRMRNNFRRSGNRMRNRLSRLTSPRSPSLQASPQVGSPPLIAAPSEPHQDSDSDSTTSPCRLFNPRSPPLIDVSRLGVEVFNVSDSDSNYAGAGAGIRNRINRNRSTHPSNVPVDDDYPSDEIDGADSDSDSDEIIGADSDSDSDADADADANEIAGDDSDSDSDSGADADASADEITGDDSDYDADADADADDSGAHEIDGDDSDSGAHEIDGDDSDSEIDGDDSDSEIEDSDYDEIDGDDGGEVVLGEEENAGEEEEELDAQIQWKPENGAVERAWLCPVCDERIDHKDDDFPLPGGILQSVKYKDPNRRSRQHPYHRCLKAHTKEKRCDLWCTNTQPQKRENGERWNPKTYAVCVLASTFEDDELPLNRRNTTCKDDIKEVVERRFREAEKKFQYTDTHSSRLAKAGYFEVPDQASNKTFEDQKKQFIEDAKVQLIALHRRFQVIIDCTERLPQVRQTEFINEMNLAMNKFKYTERILTKYMSEAAEAHLRRSNNSAQE